MMGKGKMGGKMGGKKSATVHTPAGSGSRPGKPSKHKIETSAPTHPHKLGRAPAGALK